MFHPHQNLNPTIFFTHAKMLRIYATRSTHAKGWLKLPTNPRTHTTHATHDI